jgi:AmmeMemoRadiSam system protein B/AmmeMemoRadiSam system protein A
MDSATSLPQDTPERVARPEFTKEQEATVLLAACRRVTAAVRRERAESTRQLLGEIANTQIYGAFVTLRRDGQLRSCCGHLGTAVTLGDALDHAADRAATEDPRFPPIARAELNKLDVDVWVLWGPEPVAARGEDRVGAVVIGKHGLLIERGYARGLLLPGVAVDHGFDAKTFLQQVCLKAGLPTDAWKHDDTRLMVFEGQAIHGPMADICPAAEDDARPPAVAGTFYPGSLREVQQTLDVLFESIPRTPQAWAGALAPHAGWVYSGRLAAAVFSRLAIPDCAIILCPKHRAGGAQWAVAPHRRWLFPGGELAADPDLAARLAAGVPGLELDADAHRQEHAIEVQLPLLARLAPQLRIVGITVGETSLPELLRFGIAMSVVLREMAQRPLLIVSSDMNHFADVATTNRLDDMALKAIATREPEYVYETVRQNRISMCGMAPCVVAMETLRWLGCLNRCEEVGRATSADAGGPDDRVVGYAGLLFG